MSDKLKFKEIYKTLLASRKTTFAAVARHAEVDPSTVSRWFKRVNEVDYQADSGHAFLIRDADANDVCFITNKNIRIIIDPSVSSYKLTISNNGDFYKLSSVWDKYSEYEPDSPSLSLPDAAIKAMEDEFEFDTNDLIIEGQVLIVGSLAQENKISKMHGVTIERVDSVAPTFEAEPVIEEEPVEDYSDSVWTLSRKFITINHGDNVYTCDSTHPGFAEARIALIEEDDIGKAIRLIDVRAGLENFAQGNVRIEDSSLFYKDIELKSGLADRIITLYQKGETIDVLLAFLENVMENPTRKTVYRLFDFLRANDIEITKDGYFTAWKVVTHNFLDCHSRTIDNSPGKIVEMPRFDVQDDDSITCSHGLHVCSRSYIRHFSSGNDRLVKVRVHPADVVSIPVDYNDAKMRVCKYEVLEEVIDSPKEDEYY